MDWHLINTGAAPADIKRALDYLDEEKQTQEALDELEGSCNRLVDFLARHNRNRNPRRKS